MSDRTTFENTVILVTRNGMGAADTALQQKLFNTYFSLLLDSDSLPQAVCFYTEGVYLVVEGSPVIDLLRRLESKGVHLVVCSTCINAFGLIDKVEVGIVGGMPDIIELQMRAQKVISI